MKNPNTKSGTAEIFDSHPAYVSPIAALHFVRRLYEDEDLAKSKITNLLREGKIRCNAFRILRTKGISYKKGRSRLRANLIEGRRSPLFGPYMNIPLSRWRASEDWQRDIAAFKWKAADFVVTLSLEGQSQRLWMGGVRLSRTDIDRELGTSSPSYLGRKGRIPDSVKWRTFFHTVIDAERHFEGGISSLPSKKILKKYIQEKTHLILEENPFKAELHNIWKSFGRKSQ